MPDDFNREDACAVSCAPRENPTRVMWRKGHSCGKEIPDPGLQKVYVFGHVRVSRAVVCNEIEATVPEQGTS